MRATARHWLLRTVSIGSLFASLHSGAAKAQQTYEFDLPRQSLSASLKQYAQQSGQQIIFTDDLVRGLVAGALQGRLSAGQALQQLLAGTGLVVEHAGQSAIMIRREQHAAASPALPAARPPPQEAAADLNPPDEQILSTA